MLELIIDDPTQHRCAVLDRLARRVMFPRAREQQVAQVQMHVLIRPQVLVEMDEEWPRGRVEGVDAGLFRGLAQHRILRPLPVLHVATGLEPHAHATVLVKQDSAGLEIDDEGRSREMSRQRPARERVVLTLEQCDGVFDRESFLRIEGKVLSQDRRDSPAPRVRRPCQRDLGGQSITVLFMTVPSRSSS